MRNIVILCCFLLLLVGGGVWWFVTPHDEEVVTSPLQPTITPTPHPISPTHTMMNEETGRIQTLITKFYGAYTACLTNPPTAAKGKVATYCQATTGLTTPAFVQNLKDARAARFGVDPILCSQNPPATVSADMIDFEDPTKATALAITTYGSGFAQKIPLVVSKEAGVWRVDMVTCPR